MRLAWIDVPFMSDRLRDMTHEKAKEVYDIGIRIVGCPNELDASDKDIEWAKKFLDDHGLLPGPPGLGVSPVCLDKNEEKESKKKIVQGLIYSGKLGAPSFRYSAGSMGPGNIWGPYPENVTQKAMDMLVESTKELVPYAEDANCLLIPETTQWTIVNTIERMKEFVERVDSPYVKITLDPVNHIRPDRIFESGRFMKCAIGYLGDCIGEIHCKDVNYDPARLLVTHIDEAPIGTGLLDHKALLEASRQLEPWKLFSIEHLPFDETRMDRIRSAYKHLQGIAEKIGHTWTDPKMTRDRWMKLKGK